MRCRPSTPVFSIGCAPIGITLFEVVLALAIFLGASAVIGQVLQNGSRAAARAQLSAEAAIRCERRMNEIAAGVLPLSTVSDAPFEDSGEWVWSVTVLDTGIPYLMETAVAVAHLDSRGQKNSEFILRRLIRDPMIYEDVALLSEEELE